MRGFDARYNSMDVDGNIIWNSSRNNRGTQLDVFPASVINQINVYKTVLPDQDANSIGAHIELRTLRAFDGGTGSYLKLRAAYGQSDQDGYLLTQDMETSIERRLVTAWHVEPIESLVETCRRVQVGAELQAKALKNGNDVILGNMRRSIERHMLHEVG